MSSAAVAMRPAHSLSAEAGLKKKIRDTERFLRRDNVPANVRVEMERKLAHLRDAQTERAAAERRRELDAKSRAVRFVEAKKAARRLAAASAAVLASPADAAAARAWVEAKKDELYVTSFPSGRKYVALYPSVAIRDERLLRVRDEQRAAALAAAGLTDAMTGAEITALLRAPVASASAASAAEPMDANDDESDKDGSEGSGSEEDTDSEEGPDDDDDESFDDSDDFDSDEDNASESEGSEEDDESYDSSSDVSDSEGSDSEGSEDDDDEDDDEDDDDEDDDEDGDEDEDDDDEDDDDEEPPKKHARR